MLMVTMENAPTGQPRCSLRHVRLASDLEAHSAVFGVLQPPGKVEAVAFPLVRSTCG